MDCEEEVKILKDQMRICKTTMYDELESMKRALKKQSVERKDFNHSFSKQINEVALGLAALVTAVQNITEKTDDNTDFIGTIQNIKEKTDDNTDFIDTIKKYWIRSTFISIGVIGTLAALDWLKDHGVIVMLGNTG